MADSTIPGLDAVITPASTDEFSVRQSGDTRDKKQTRAQLHTLQSGEHFILPSVDEPLTPTFAFGDGDTGFYQKDDNQLRMALNGGVSWLWSASQFFGVNGAAGMMLNAAATATLPTLVPNRGDTDTGIGSPGADQLSLVAGALDCIQVSNVSAARRIGFYVTAPVALQTGVAVTAAGVHAALVNLGLITA